MERSGTKTNAPPRKEGHASVGGDCRSVQAIIRYLIGTMSRDERIAFEAHCKKCKTCRSKLEGARRGVADFLSDTEGSD